MTHSWDSDAANGTGSNGGRDAEHGAGDTEESQAEVRDAVENSEGSPQETWSEASFQAPADGLLDRVPTFGRPDAPAPFEPSPFETAPYEPARYEPAPFEPPTSDWTPADAAQQSFPIPPQAWSESPQGAPGQDYDTPPVVPPPYPASAPPPGYPLPPADAPMPGQQPFGGQPFQAQGEPYPNNDQQQPSAPAPAPFRADDAPVGGRHHAARPNAPQQAPSPPQQGPSQQGPASAPPGFPPQQAPAPARIPRPEDLLVPDQSPPDAQPASWGWRGRLNRGTGGMFKAKPSAQETAVRDAIVRIQRGFSRPMTVVVVQPKGGAGKTPTTICLSAAFGAHRGGYVVGWDDNETRGTLAVRVLNPSSQPATVWDLLSDLAAFERSDARVGDLSHYVRAQPDAHFDALVSDDNPGNMAQIGEAEFHRLHRVLQRFYRMIVVDTGNNVRSSNWQAAVDAADLVVVVSTYQRDVGYSGSWVLDHLAQTGRQELARNAVTVLTAADPTTDKTVREQLIEHFTSRTRAVAEIPYDAALAHGGPIKWTDLAPETRNAWTLAGATVVDALADQDRQGPGTSAGG